MVIRAFGLEVVVSETTQLFEGQRNQRTKSFSVTLFQCRQMLAKPTGLIYGHGSLGCPFAVVNSIFGTRGEVNRTLSFDSILSFPKSRRQSFALSLPAATSRNTRPAIRIFSVIHEIACSSLHEPRIASYYAGRWRGSNKTMRSPALV